MQKRKSKGKRIVCGIFIALGVLLYLFSAYLILVPVNQAEEQPGQQAAQTFTRRTEVEREKTQTVLTEAEVKLQELTPEEVRNHADIPYADLLADLMQYNRDIYLNRQIDFDNAWAYRAQKFDLASYGVEDDVIAVIDIPALEESFPIYLGATSAHLGNGLAQLTETSVPIGGVNTNCVIAGHRGWDNGKYLRDIEKIQLGDVLTVTNLWETLHYEVVDIVIIRPNNINEVKIRDGRDLLTLVTCHPYASGGRYRYLVVCERVEGERSSIYVEEVTEPTEQISEPVESTTIRVRRTRDPDERIDFFSSANEIFIDEFLRILGIIFVIIAPVILLFVALYRRHKRKKEEERRRVHREVVQNRKREEARRRADRQEESK